MAEGLNRVMLLGSCGADPELRFTAGGQAVLNIRLATNESYFDKTANERKERTDWHNVVVWGKRAEGLAKIVAKGSSLFIEGSLRTSSYDDRDGNKRYKTEINATNVILAGGRGARDQGDGPPRARPQREAPTFGPEGSAHNRPRNYEDDFEGYGDGNADGDGVPF